MDPDRQDCHGEEVVEEYEGSSDDPCQQPNGSINTLATALKVSKTAKLECF